MKDWRREWLYNQTHRPSFYAAPKGTLPLVLTKVGYQRMDPKKTQTGRKGLRLWRQWMSKRKNAFFDRILDTKLF
jgi:hypothetical protein